MSGDDKREGRRVTRPLRGLHTVASVVLEVLGACSRRVALWLSLLAGIATRVTSHGWGPAIKSLAFVALGLLALAPLVNAAFALLGHVDAWKVLEVDPEPQMGTQWTGVRVLGIVAALLVIRWFLRARERVVIEEFVDYTSADATAVQGLATLLVAELGRLRELYGRVNDQLSVPPSIAVRNQVGSSGAEDAGAFLSVRADDVTEVLRSAVASEVSVSVGPLRVPVGPLLSMIGRVARGPRVLGSVHYTDAGGGPTLTTQIVGMGENFTWRVDASELAEHGGNRAFLDPMVSELACRMFTDLTLQRTVRSRAVQAFTEYLTFYWESLRTPRNRASSLKQAEGKLLEAVSEDETFDLAYYNLGVIYSQLAEAEFRAAEASEYVQHSDGDPELGHRARTTAAIAAFARAVSLNRERPEAVYGLAVHEFTSLVRAERRGDTLGAEDRNDRLEMVCRLCDRVTELDRSHAQAYDLKGLALQGLDLAAEAERCHRTAVRHSWHCLCQAVYADRAHRVATDTVLPNAQANAAAALNNLAAAHASQAERRRNGARRWLRFYRADRIFHQALTLTPVATRAATVFERGRMCESWNRGRLAIQAYDAAGRLEPTNPLYYAHLGRVYAREKRVDDARSVCASALTRLAPIYRRTIEPFATPSMVQLRERTLEVLEDAHKALGCSKDVARIRRLSTLYDTLRKLSATRDDISAYDGAATELAHMQDEYRDRPWSFEYEQIAVVLGRVYSKFDFESAAEFYRQLIKELDTKRPRAVVEHALHARHAQALRRTGHREEALQAATRGLLLNPLSAPVRRELGKAHFALLQFDEAVDAWEHTLWLTPNDPVLHWKVAYCHWCIAQDRQEQDARLSTLENAARYFYQAALLAGPEKITCWAWSKLWLGRVRLEQHRYDDAVQELRAAKGCQATALPARLFLAEAHQANGETYLSLNGFTRVLEDAHPWIEKHGADARVDQDWGETLVGPELVVRSECGLAYWEAEAEGQLDHALERVSAAEESARRIEGNVRGPASTWARCLHVQAMIHARRKDFDAALACSYKAASVSPAPAYLIHAMQFHEAVTEQADAGDRAANLLLLRGTLDRLRRMDANGVTAHDGQAILNRLESPDTTAVNGNGNGNARFLKCGPLAVTD
jgi:tetratricopeptide (TPR) repeat protein